MVAIIIMIIMFFCFTEEEIEAQKDLGVIEQSVKRNNLDLFGFKVCAVSFLFKYIAWKIYMKCVIRQGSNTRFAT